MSTLTQEKSGLILGSVLMRNLPADSTSATAETFTIQAQSGLNDSDNIWSLDCFGKDQFSSKVLQNLRAIQTMLVGRTIAQAKVLLAKIESGKISSARLKYFAGLQEFPGTY